MKKTTLGKILKSARSLKGATLREVEKKTKISNAYISQLESNFVTEPSPHKLYSLAKFYEIDYATLMELAGYYVPYKQVKLGET